MGKGVGDGEIWTVWYSVLHGAAFAATMCWRSFLLGAHATQNEAWLIS